jgi:4-diphosphocytidyl-2-C-methyl-D-erythritol kinase
LIIFPNCKINLGLNITGKRADGYHNIETVFYPIQLKDVLEVVENPGGTDFEFHSSGISIPGEQSKNLCRKAWQLLKKDFAFIPPIQTFLHKAIPIGAGLGGGSSNGAFTLQLLNQKFRLGLSAAELQQYALQLGSDCPFFIHNKPCMASGRGEILEPLQLDLHAYHIAIVNPGIHISTAWAFSQIAPSDPLLPLSDIVGRPIASWKDHLVNDFEAPVFREYPQIEELKKRLYADGALFASMTGTGSTVYGIFSSEPRNYLSLRG